MKRVGHPKLCTSFPQFLGCPLNCAYRVRFQDPRGKMTDHYEGSVEISAFVGRQFGIESCQDIEGLGEHPELIIKTPGRPRVRVKDHISELRYWYRAALTSLKPSFHSFTVIPWQFRCVQRQNSALFRGSSTIRSSQCRYTFNDRIP